MLATIPASLLRSWCEVPGSCSAGAWWLCINDRVGLPRPLCVPGQESFMGVVADGTSDSLAGGAKQNVLESLWFFGGLGETCRDPNTVTTVTTHCPKRCATGIQGQVGAAGINWRGKRVVIAGMGAFAVENVQLRKMTTLSEIPDSFDALNYRSWLLNSGCWLFLL